VWEQVLAVSNESIFTDSATSTISFDNYTTTTTTNDLPDHWIPDDWKNLKHKIKRSSKGRFLFVFEEPYPLFTVSRTFYAQKKDDLKVSVGDKVPIDFIDLENGSCRSQDGWIHESVIDLVPIIVIE